MEKKKLIIFAMSMGSGGAERVISLLLTKLVEDYEVHLFLFFNKISYVIPPQVEVHCHSNKEFLSAKDRILQLPSIFRAYQQLIIKENISISISFLTIPNLINGLLSKLGTQVKTIVSERNYPSIEYRSSHLRYGIYRILIPYLYSAADIIFSNSRHINEDLAKNFGIKKKMQVVYNPTILHEEGVSYSSAETTVQFKLIHVGRLIPVKNHEMIFNALQELKDPAVSLQLLGAGELQEHLLCSIQQKNISSAVVFLGNVQNVFEHLKRNDCFVFSSLSEGFPNALLEAMEAGLPVISANCKSGPLEILNEDEEILIADGTFARAKYGLLVNVNDYLGMAAAIKFLKDNKEERQKFAALSRKRAADYSLEVIYKQFHHMLEH